MPIIKETDVFKKTKTRLDKSYLYRLEKLIKKIIENPKTGKPMKYSRVGTREVYLAPFRVSYSYNKSENILLFLEIYHKRKQ